MNTPAFSTAISSNYGTLGGRCNCCVSFTSTTISKNRIHKLFIISYKSRKYINEYFLMLHELPGPVAGVHAEKM